MEPIEIRKDIYWVGAVDYNIRDFHGYSTPKGTTYNSYLIVDEKIVLIDTVKSTFFEELKKRISQIVNPPDIDYLVINHVEMDHSGSAERIMELAGDAQVLSTDKGKDFLHSHYEGSSTWNIKTVDDGDHLDIGKRSLQFIPSPMLHWPDTMFTYSKVDKILFSNDGFGQHIATPHRFMDEARKNEVFYEAKKYYANILMPYSRIAEKKLGEMSGLKIEVICPSHGVIFREEDDIQSMVSLYKKWASGETDEKAVIVYDTMYGSTERMARSLEDGLTMEGVETRTYNLRVSDVSEIIGEVLEAKAVLVGSSTLNNGPLPTVGGFLTYLKGLRPRGKIGASFGSFGWGGGAVKTIEESLKDSGMKLPEGGLQIKFVPGSDSLSNCYELGRRIGEQIKS